MIQRSIDNRCGAAMQCAYPHRATLQESDDSVRKLPHGHPRPVATAQPDAAGLGRCCLRNATQPRSQLLGCGQVVAGSMALTAAGAVMPMVLAPYRSSSSSMLTM